MKPLITVIIPVYNAEHFIAETINSVLSQSYSDFEIILVNDGSTDNSENIMRTFLTDKRISLISSKNEGVSSARNKGIEIAKGEYIAFLDADDVWHTDYLAKKLNLLEKNPAAGWAFCNYKMIDKNSQQIGQHHFPQCKNIHEALLNWKISINPSNLFIAKKCFSKNLRFDTAFSTAADQDFNFYLSKDFPGIFLDEELFSYRVLSDSMGRNMTVFEKDHLAVYRKAAAKNLFSSAKMERKCFAKLYLILAGSWWKNGNHKPRAMKYILKSFFKSPSIIFQKLIKEGK